jgi:predicted ABC-type transport system involved in lysophospholipase L1 biosynthesis ATPase subunit
MSDIPDTVPLVEACHLTKSYRLGGRTIDVLKGVSLVAPRGDFLALRGASGAGKSTLLHLLGGLDLPNSGEVLFSGQSLRSLGSSELARWRNTRVGFIFQAYHLLPELNALENVCIPARLARAAPAKVAEKARDLLARVGLADRLDHRPLELSGGEQQRVVIARCLINSPDLILADEPTGNLDSHTGEEIMDLLCVLRREFNTTMIIATHDLQVARRAARSLDLQDGAVKNPAPTARPNDSPGQRPG